MSLFVMLMTSIISFITDKFTEISGNEDVVNNAAYMFVNLIPFVFLKEK